MATVFSANCTDQAPRMFPNEVRYPATRKWMQVKSSAAARNASMSTATASEPGFQSQAARRTRAEHHDAENAGHHRHGNLDDELTRAVEQAVSPESGHDGSQIDDGDDDRDGEQPDEAHG